MSPGRWQPQLPLPRLLLLLLLLVLVQTLGRERAVGSPQTVLPAPPLLWGWGVRLPLPRRLSLCLSFTQLVGPPGAGSLGSSPPGIVQRKAAEPVVCGDDRTMVVMMMMMGIVTAWCVSGNPVLARPCAWIF